MGAQCPYGASDCPRVDEMKQTLRTLEERQQKMENDIVALKTTIKNFSYFVSMITSVLGICVGYLL